MGLLSYDVHDMMYRRVMRVTDAKGMREDKPKKKRKKSKKEVGQGKDRSV